MSKFVTGTSHKSRKVALILCFIGGFFGLHYFYVGRYGKGFLFLFTLGFCFVGYFVDIIKILTGNFYDSNGAPLIEW